MNVTSQVMVQNLDVISDHSLITFKVHLDSDSNRKLPHKTEQYFNGRDIRKFLESEKFVEESLMQEDLLLTPLR
jgi:hypothetical protein